MWALQIAFGWLLGILSSVGLDWWKARGRKRAIKRALGLELKEVRYRLLVVVYLCELKYGQFDRKLLEWALPLVRKYRGINPKDGALAGIEGLLGRTDQEIAQVAAVERRAGGVGGQYHQMIDAPYTASVAAELRDLADDFQVRVLDVRAHLGMFNEIVENTRYYERLTFAGNMSADNHARAVCNADNGQRELAKRARIVVQKITDLEAKYPTDFESD